jgi:hypothetical protein
MKTQLPLLRSIYIASPCPVSWDSMQGTEQVRHCGQCQTKVYDLSEMTADDAEALLLKEEGDVCVRFYRRADGTISTRDCPKGVAARAWHAVRWAVVAGFMLVFGWLLYATRESNKSENPPNTLTGKPGYHRVGNNLVLSDPASKASDP